MSPRFEVQLHFRAMETGCWVLGGEFEDSVFEQRPERRPEPPSPYRAKLCEPQVRRLPLLPLRSGAGLRRGPPPSLSTRPATKHGDFTLVPSGCLSPSPTLNPRVLQAGPG